MPTKLTQTFTDRLGRERTVTYKYRFPTLKVGKAYYSKSADYDTIHSERVLAYRWAKLNGWNLYTKITKSGRLKVQRFI